MCNFFKDENLFELCLDGFERRADCIIVRVSFFHSDGGRCEVQSELVSFFWSLVLRSYFRNFVYLKGRNIDD